jgi:dTDP-4-amino-4,6-dideoxygalactose transaminase
VIRFRDLRREMVEVEAAVRDALDAVLEESRFIGGARVAEFESEFAAFCGSAHAVGTSSGTDAITIALLAVGIGPGDEVITAANTCVPTVLGIAATGATPVLADVNRETLTLDPESVAAAIGPRTRAVVPVHLYGRRAELDPLLDLRLRVVEDAAQAHGSAAVADVAAFSFYPTKNLGALGDAGAVVTSDETAAHRARELREERGGLSGLDTLQAAALQAKLPQLARWNARRREIAARYDEGLRDGPVELPPPSKDHSYHLYVVRSADRDALRSRLREHHVETLVHYSLAVHQNPGWSGLDRPGRLVESERAAREVVSLPLYPQLTDDEVDRVIESVLA